MTKTLSTLAVAVMLGGSALLVSNQAEAWWGYGPGYGGYGYPGYWGGPYGGGGYPGYWGGPYGGGYPGRWGGPYGGYPGWGGAPAWGGPNTNPPGQTNKSDSK